MGADNGVRIISGRYKNTRLNVGANANFKPMGERERNAIFNAVYSELGGSGLAGMRVLDAFAGSGAVGVEAMSRGATNAVFVEKDRGRAKILRENLQKIGVLGGTGENGSAIVIDRGIEGVIGDLSRDFDVVFADPPYEKPQYETVEKLFGLVADGGLFVLSFPHENPPEFSSGVLDGFKMVFDNKYARAGIRIWRRK